MVEPLSLALLRAASLCVLAGVLIAGPDSALAQGQTPPPVSPPPVAPAPAAPVTPAPAPAPAAPAAPNAAPAAPMRTLTLDEALQLAEGGSEQIASAQAGVRRADGQIGLARSGLYPQLLSSFGYQRTLQTQFEGIFDAPSGPPCADLTVNPDAPIADRIGELERFLQCPASSPFGGGDSNDLPFGQLNTWTANLQASQRVYDGGQLRAQERQARAGREAATLGVTTTRAQLGLDVATTFYDAALSDRLVTITEATQTQAGETLRQIELQQQVGEVAEFEVLRARVARDNQRAAVIRTRIQRDLAYLRLKQLINVPADQPLALDANLREPNGALASRWSTALADAEAGVKELERVAVQQTAAAVRANEAAVDVTRSQFRPQVSLASSFIAYAYDRLPVFDRRDWTVGAAVSLPLLDGGRRKANRSIAQATLEQSQAQLQQVRELADLDLRSAYATYQAARAAWDASAGTVEQAQRAYQIADVRYREGLSTQLELNDARLALERADADRAQAARDLQVTRARLALLPELPLGAAGAGTAAGIGQAEPTGPSPAAAVTGAGAGAGTVGTATQTGVVR